MPSLVTTKATRALHLTYPPEELAVVAQQLARQWGHPLVRWWPDAADPYRIWLEVRPTCQGSKPSLLRLTGTLPARNEEHDEPARSEGIGQSRGNADLYARILLDAATLEPRALAPFSHTREMVRGSLLSLQQVLLFKYLKLALRKG
jgi:hypothetical protein